MNHFLILFLFREKSLENNKALVELSFEYIWGNVRKSILDHDRPGYETQDDLKKELQNFVDQEILEKHGSNYQITQYGLEQAEVLHQLTK